MGIRDQDRGPKINIVMFSVRYIINLKEVRFEADIATKIPLLLLVNSSNGVFQSFGKPFSKLLEKTFQN